MGHRGRRVVWTWMVGLAIGLVVGAAIPVALAGTAYGTWKNYGPVDGHSYQSRSWVNTNSSGALAATIAQTQNGSNVPAGYMGVQPRLFNSDGTMCASTVWEYNSSACSGWAVPSPRYKVHGTYYSYGKTQAWTGSTYNTYFTNKSPSQTY